MRTSKDTDPPQPPSPPPPTVPPKDVQYKKTATADPAALIVLPTEAAAAAEVSKANRQRRNTNEKKQPQSQPQQQQQPKSSSTRGLKFWRSSEERIRRPSLPKLGASSFRSLRRDAKSSVSVPRPNSVTKPSSSTPPPTPPSEEDEVDDIKKSLNLLQFFNQSKQQRVIGMEGSDYATLDQCCQVIKEYLQQQQSTNDNDAAATAFHAIQFLIDQYEWPSHIKLESWMKKNDMVKLISDMCSHLCGNDNNDCFAPKYVCENPHPLVDLRIQENNKKGSGSSSSLPDYANMWPDHMDRNTGRFRRHFVGKPYLTFVTPPEDISQECAIVSAVRECDSDNKDVVFHIIVRSSTQGKAEYYTLTEADLYKSGGSIHVETETESNNNESNSTTIKFSSPPQMPPLRSRIGSIRRKPFHEQDDSSSHRVLRKAVSTARPDIQIHSLRSLSAEATIMAGMEKELLRFDEMAIPKNYKFGLLVVRGSQRTEEEWYSNTGLSDALARFLNLIGTKIDLNGYDGYAGGLDTKAGETGEFSYVSRWREHQIMFHVCPLMPLREQDKQQINRKRHIGNDIVCIVFIEQGGEFDPTIVRSQFLHVFIVVRHISPDSWSIQVIRQATVPEFGPHIPVTLPSSHLKDFLLLKMINAENAALKADKFAQPNMKARVGILKNIAASVADVSSRKSGERPRSTGRYRERISLDVSTPLPPVTIAPPPPPQPTPTRSRSTVLRDFTRRARLASNNTNNNNNNNSNGSNNNTKTTSNSNNNTTNANDASKPPLLNTPISSISSAFLGESRLRARAQNLMTSVMNRRS